MKTVHLEDNFVDSLKLDFETADIKEAILKLYQFYINSKEEDIVKNTHKEAHEILQGLEEIKQGKTNNIQKLFNEL
jgi:uncharacterized protein YeeX (DUF496 family)